MDDINKRMAESRKKFNKLKKNMFVRWIANRALKQWDCIGVITKKTANFIVVLSFDDFKETQLSYSGDAVREEINIVTKDEAVEYLKKRMIALGVEKQHIIANHQTQIFDHDALIAKLGKKYDEILNIKE